MRKIVTLIIFVGFNAFTFGKCEKIYRSGLATYSERFDTYEEVWSTEAPGCSGEQIECKPVDLIGYFPIVAFKCPGGLTEVSQIGCDRELSNKIHPFQNNTIYITSSDGSACSDLSETRRREECSKARQFGLRGMYFENYDSPNFEPNTWIDGHSSTANNKHRICGLCEMDPCSTSKCEGTPPK